MEFVSKVNDILMLEDEKSYFVKKQVVFNNENYLLLQEVPDRLQDIYPETAKPIEFVKEVVENEELFLETVESTELKKQLINEAKK